MRGLAMICNQICHYFYGSIHRNSKSYALCTYSDCNVNTDDFAVNVEEWPAGVTWIDVGVGLDQVVILLRTVDRNISMKSANDSNGY